MENPSVSFHSQRSLYHLQVAPIFPNLEVLGLRGCGLVGHLPSSFFGMIPKIRILDLARQNIVRLLPPGVERLPETLEVLHLDGNPRLQLAETLTFPAGLRTLTMAECPGAAAAVFSRAVDDEPAPAREPSSVELNDRFAIRRFPQSLQVVDLSGNNLTIIPPSLAEAPLRQLALADNLIEEVPEWAGDRWGRTLTSVNLRRNRLRERGISSSLWRELALLKEFDVLGNSPGGPALAVEWSKLKSERGIL
mmetsp:Transcript_24536/g.61284  ORF Transcript_24536/g.61284 Transcript_24536/m.61284 type:complete len:250 (+) Transcript_24536:297-1046(+)